LKVIGNQDKIIGAALLKKGPSAADEQHIPNQDFDHRGRVFAQGSDKRGGMRWSREN